MPNDTVSITQRSPEESIDVLRESLGNLWDGLVNFFWPFITAIIIFIVGWVIATLVGHVIARVIRSLHVDSALEGVGFKTALERAGMRLDVGRFIGELVKWYVIIAVLLTATNILGLTEVTEFLREVLRYVPNVIVAALILIATALVANFLSKLVRGSVDAAGLTHGNFVGAVAKWATWIFGVSAALIQLGIGADLIRILVTGIVAMLALAAGLAFGLGGRDFAAGVIDKLRREAGQQR